MDTALENRILGTLYGQAVGDALGLGMEGMSKAQVESAYPKGLKDYNQIIQDAHRRQWRRGDWTDDTEQMTLILDSLLETGQLDVCDIARRFRNWLIHGGLGVGNTVYAVLNHPLFLSNPHVASKDVWERSGCKIAANGAVMRTSVMGLWEFNNPQRIKDNAEVVCKITHFDPRCVGSCVAVSLLINGLVKGHHEQMELIKEVESIAVEYDLRIKPYWDSTLNQPLETLDLDNEADMGYTLKTLSAGIWALVHSESFEEGILSIIHEGGDADTNASVAGALLGARYGLSAIPHRWVEKLTWKKYMQRVSRHLLRVIEEKWEPNKQSIEK